MKRVLACAVIGVLCAFTGSAAASNFHPGAPGIGDPYFPLDGNGGYDVGHYSLDVSYDPPTDSPRPAPPMIEATASENLSSFNLDLRGLTVHGISVDGWAAKWSRSDDELTVTPKIGLRKRTLVHGRRALRRRARGARGSARACSTPTTVS